MRPGAEARDELLRADTAFSDYASAHGVAEAFRAFFTEDATSIDEGGDFVHGRDAVVAGLVMPPGAKLTLACKPLAADVSAAGDLGYTYGRFTSEVTAPDGTHKTRHGKYMTVWRRQTDGSWKAVVDMGNASPDAT